MRTKIKFNALAQLPDDQKFKALAQAISLELQKPALLQDMMEGKSALCGRQAYLLNDADRPKAPTAEQIKNYLARKWTVGSDTPALMGVATEVESFWHSNMPEIDTGYEAAFDFMDLRASGYDHFDLIDTNAGISFNQVKPGQEVKIRRAISETQTVVKYLEIADGLGLLNDWIRFNKFWNIDEAVAEFRAKFYDRKAELHYGLLTALPSGVNVPFDTDDAKTFNNAAAALFRALRERGYGLGQNPSLLIFAPPEQAGRINKMLMATQGSQIVSMGTLSQPIAFTVRAVITSTHIPANSTGYYLVLPGRKIKRADWQDLTVVSDNNIYTNATDWVGRGKFNAIIGDQAQVRRVLFA